MFEEQQKKIKVLFGTVVYPNARRYFDDFANSLNKQTCDSFELLIINDGVDRESLNLLIDQIGCNCYVVQTDMNASICRNRDQLIREAKILHYDLLIIGDIDDTFSENRIERYLDEYDLEHSFYYNRIADFITTENVFLKLPRYVDNIEDILEQNFLGLSNTGINLRVLDINHLPSINDDILIYDWYLYSRFLLTGNKGKLIDNTYTYYRLHAENLIGNQFYNNTHILDEVKIKLKHYNALAQYSDKINGMLKKYEMVLNRIENDLSVTLQKNENKYWWNIIDIKE